MKAEANDAVVRDFYQRGTGMLAEPIRSSNVTASAVPRRPGRHKMASPRLRGPKMVQAEAEQAGRNAPRLRRQRMALALTLARLFASRMR